MEENAAPAEGQTLVKTAARFGAIMGGISIALTAVIYVANYTLLVDWKMLIVYLVLFIGFTIYAGISYRNQGDGFLEYGKAWQFSYVMFLTCGVVSLIFTILLYNVIDPALPQALTDATVDKTADMMKSFGAPEDKIEETLDQVRIDTPNRFTVVGQLKQFAWGLVINAIFALITAIFIKKNKPEVM